MRSFFRCLLSFSEKIVLFSSGVDQTWKTLTAFSLTASNKLTIKLDAPLSPSDSSTGMIQLIALRTHFQMGCGGLQT